MTSPFKEIDNQTKTSEDLPPMSESEKDLMAETEFAGAFEKDNAVNLGSIEPTERGRSLSKFKKEVLAEAYENQAAGKKGYMEPLEYFSMNPTEESDEMADKIIAAKNTTLNSSIEDLNAQGYKSRGDHFTRVEKPLQVELKNKIKNRIRQ